MSSDAARIRLTSAARLHARRRNVLVVFVLALLFLVLAMSAFVVMHQRDVRSRFDLRQARESLLRARHQEDLARQRSTLHAVLKNLAKRARTLGLAPEQWSERKINLHQQSISRDAANDILLSTARGNGRLFAVTAFDLSVTRSDESLFKAPAENNQSLRMTMSGTSLFGTQGNH